jgi:hypothetical protein
LNAVHDLLTPDSKQSSKDKEEGMNRLKRRQGSQEREGSLIAGDTELSDPDLATLPFCDSYDTNNHGLQDRNIGKAEQIERYMQSEQSLKDKREKWRAGLPSIDALLHLSREQERINNPQLPRLRRSSYYAPGQLQEAHYLDGLYDSDAALPLRSRSMVEKKSMDATSSSPDGGVKGPTPSRSLRRSRRFRWTK